MVYFGYTRQTWAKKHGISLGYLDLVRGGFDRSDRVVGLIREFIRCFERMVAEDYIARHPELCEAA